MKISVKALQVIFLIALKNEAKLAALGDIVREEDPATKEDTHKVPGAVERPKVQVTQVSQHSIKFCVAKV